MMKKILSILFSIFCIFSFNTCFITERVSAAPEDTAKELPELPMDGKVDDDILREPIFSPEKKKPEQNKVAIKAKSLFFQIVGGAALLVIIIFCGSFIWFANLQRRRDSRRKKYENDSNVIDAIDNFARHRIR